MLTVAACAGADETALPGIHHEFGSFVWRVRLEEVFHKHGLDRRATTRLLEIFQKPEP